MAEFYIVVSYDNHTSTMRLHTFTPVVNTAKDLFDKLVEMNPSDEYYFVEMLKISEFDNIKGLLLFFSSGHIECEYARVMYQWNNGLTSYEN